MRKKRIFALLMGAGLISIPLALLWLDTPFFLRYWPCIPVILALIPGTVGGIVGAWIRNGSDHPWLRASGFGVLVWWGLLLVVLIAFLIWFRVVLYSPASGSAPGGGFHQPGYGNGLLLAFVIIYMGVYALVGLPFILLGTTITYPRRGVAS